MGQCSETAYSHNIGCFNSLPARCFFRGGPKVYIRVACIYGGGVPVQRHKLPVRLLREKEIWLIILVLSAMQNTYSINSSCQYLASYALETMNDCPSAELCVIWLDRNSILMTIT